MVSTALLVALLSAAASAFAASMPLMSRSGTPSSTGTHEGYFYSWWTDGVDQATYANLAGGRYNVIWSGNNGSFVGGKGWNPGSARNVSFNAYFAPLGNAYLSLYGQTTNPLVEYYIMENFGGPNDPASDLGLSKKGNVTSDGGTYDIYIGRQATVDQYFSIRQQKRSVGTITTANHFTAWKSLGLSLGTFDYQILATEGHLSAGSSTVTIVSPPAGDSAEPRTGQWS